MEYIKSISFYFPLSELVCPRAYVFLNWDVLQELSFCFILKKILVCSALEFPGSSFGSHSCWSRDLSKSWHLQPKFQEWLSICENFKMRANYRGKKLWFYQFYLDLIFITAFKNNLTLLRECNWLFVQMYYFSVLPENLMPVKILEQCY